MIYDTSPVPGTVVADLGHGVTVVQRNPPRTEGTVWVAPYSLNCAEHGWIVSRRTVEECGTEGRQHIAVELGAAHRAAGTAPFGDLDDTGSALLMDALGETGPTTEGNHPGRVALVDAYRDALEGRRVAGSRAA